MRKSFYVGMVLGTVGALAVMEKNKLKRVLKNIKQ